MLSEDPGVVAKSLSFVKDVLLQDFPPELFLQRPAILKVAVHTDTHRRTHAHLRMYIPLTVNPLPRAAVSSGGQ